MAPDGSPTAAIVRPQWHAKAACREEDSALFFPEKGQTGERARAICAGCPVREPCYEFAVSNRLVGIWGGSTGKDRRKARSQAAARPQEVGKRRVPTRNDEHSNPQVRGPSAASPQVSGPARTVPAQLAQRPGLKRELTYGIRHSSGNGGAHGPPGVAAVEDVLAVHDRVGPSAARASVRPQVGGERKLVRRRPVDVGVVPDDVVAAGTSLDVVRPVIAETSSPRRRPPRGRRGDRRSRCRHLDVAAAGDVRASAGAAA